MSKASGAAARSAQVVVFGSLNMDLTIESDRVPQAGETITGRGFFANPGGKGANQAVAAAKMGAPTSMIGAVGADSFGDQLVASLGARGVGCEHVDRSAGRPTGVACITRVDGDNRIILEPGANYALGAAEVAEALDALARRGDVFLTQLECDYETTLASLAAARERGMRVVLNPAPARALPDEVWESVDVACLNETECATITGMFPATEDDALRAMRSLAEKGVGTVVITLGSRGSVALVDGRMVRVAARRVEVADTTCAGDTYIGAVVAGLAQGMAVEETLNWASCAAALATTRLGAQCSIPTCDEVGELLEAEPGA